jgi:putative alpha-1,2-mannosidase
MAMQMEGWMNAFEESGGLGTGHVPSWASPGDRGTMTGNMQDASFADAIVKGITDNLGGANVTHRAYLALLDNTFNATGPSPRNDSSGRRKGLAEYMVLGYIPLGKGYDDEVSGTLNYALSDYRYCICTLCTAYSLSVLHMHSLCTAYTHSPLNYATLRLQCLACSGCCGRYGHGSSTAQPQ